MCLRGLFFFMHKRKTGTAIHKRFLFFFLYIKIKNKQICFVLYSFFRNFARKIYFYQHDYKGFSQSGYYHPRA